METKKMTISDVFGDAEKRILYLFDIQVYMESEK